MLEQARALLPEDKGLLGCGRWMVHGQEVVKLLHLPKTMGARLKNVQRCGSVWPCPVCSVKITERKRQELRGGVDAWRSGGGSVVMSTYTCAHQWSDNLPTLLGASSLGSVKGGDLVAASGLLGARSVSMSGRAYNDLKRICGLVGSVRCLEVTFGENGWHPHFHDLGFVVGDEEFLRLVAADKLRYLEDLQTERTRQYEALASGGRKLRARAVRPALKFLPATERKELLAAGLERLWHEGLAAAGLIASEEHGFKFSEAGDEIETYIAKWGHEPIKPVWDCAAEIAKQPAKLGKKKGKTPMQLLSECTFGGGAEADRAGALFASYARSMKGRQQLVWSNGLRARLGLGEELSDAELVDCREDKDALTFGEMRPAEFGALAADRLQGRLVNALKAGDAGRVAALIARYVGWGEQVDALCTRENEDGSFAGTSSRTLRRGFGRVVLDDRTADDRDRLPVVGVYHDAWGDQLAQDRQAGQLLARRLRERKAAGESVHDLDREADQRREAVAAVAPASVHLPPWLYDAVHDLVAYPRLLDAVLTEEEAALLCQWKATFKARYDVG